MLRAEALPPGLLTVGIFLLRGIPRLFGVRGLHSACSRLRAVRTSRSRRILYGRFVRRRGLYVVIRINLLRLLRVLLLFFLARLPGGVRHEGARGKTEEEIGRAHV